MRKIINSLGTWISGGIFKVDSEIQFDTTTNPEIDSTGGGFIWNIITATANAWRLRDNGTDIITINTSTDVIETKYHTIVTNQVTQIAFANSPYTAVWGQDLEVDCTAGAVTINLPTAVGNNGKSISITRIDASANTITIDGSTTETINGALTKSVFSQWESVTLKSNNTNITLR